MQTLVKLNTSCISKRSKYGKKWLLTTLRCTCLLLFVTSLFLPCLAGEENQSQIYYHYLPAVKNEVYSELGDINIGEIVDIYSQKPGTQECNDVIRDTSDVPENTLPIQFAVDLANRNPNLLPNVTLGFVLSAACETIPMKLATSLPYLPRNERICNGSECYAQLMRSQSDSKYVSHDVIGILAPAKDAEAAAISSLFAAARTPVIGYLADSDELKVDQVHSYFFRVNTRFSYQIKGILKFASSNGWAYIQMVYLDNDYGRDAYKFMHQYAGKYGVCIAESHLLDDYDVVATDLLKKRRARAVVSFVQHRIWEKLLKAIGSQNGSYNFIWIGSSVMNGYKRYNSKQLSMDPGIGAFIIYPSTIIIPEYYDYIRNIDINTTNNPWLKNSWEQFQQCSYSNRTCESNFDVLKTGRYFSMKYSSLKIDAVMSFAHAAHDLLKNRCPLARGKEARECITGELLREYLKKVAFQGYNENMYFSPTREVIGRFTIRQIAYGYSSDMFSPANEKQIFEKPVAIYQCDADKITISNENISWSHLKEVERIDPTKGEDTPESVCSRPCVVGQYKIEKKVPCCWDCLYCHDNERLVNGRTGCEACPLLSWPDSMSEFTTCVDIPPSYQTTQDTIPKVLVSVAILSITCTIFIISAYFKYRNERVIKTSGMELNIIQSVGIVTGYTTVILFQTKPTHTMCRTIFFLFCMSFALLYCPLFVKTVRIVRVVKNTAKNNQPRFVSSQSQMVVSIVLITIQILLCSANVSVFMSGARRTQPIWSEKLVELSCDFTLPGLASAMGYNVLLVCLCAVFAYIARELPDNYNESKFISMCVSTTLLIWMAFIPTYLTAAREYIRMFLLCMTLILNHTVALLLLFLPKLYAAKCVAIRQLDVVTKMP